MADRELIDLGLMLLDRQLLDADGRRCGKVDDVEIDGGPGEEATVSALVSGSEAWRSGSRGPLAWLAARLGRGQYVRITLDRVEDVESAVRLRVSADELGLADGDNRAARWVRGWPGA
jgi:sporulation protein YlmC with PRC-barrel domain